MSAPDIFDADTRFVYKNVGYGAVSFEPADDFDRIENDKLFTDTFSTYGLEWTAQGWMFDSGLGLVAYAVRRDTLTAKELAELEELEAFAND